MVRIPVFTSLLETVSRAAARNSRVKPRSMAVIITTYNNPRWLEKVLWGYSIQQFDEIPVKLIIADDGSKEPTRSMLAQMRHEIPQELVHVWHPDRGFQKTRILNRAIAAAESDYLIFTDHDCVPRNDFLATHYGYAERNYFLSGGYVKLSMEMSERLTPEDIVSGRAFRSEWLKSQGFSLQQWLPKLTTNKTLAAVLNWITPTDATWNGHCSSCWADDALAVNGYNEQMQYGGLDREFGERLLNLGVKAKQLRYSFPLLHLDHPRPYATPESIARNKAFRGEVRRSKTILPPFGIREMLAEKTDDGFTVFLYGQDSTIPFAAERKRKAG